MPTEIAEKVQRGERLDAEDGLALYEIKDLLQLGRLAEQVTLARQGRNVYYSINRHINYTNICKMQCRFCGFSRRQGQNDAYVLSEQEVIAQAQAAYEQGATEVHIVGGVNPELKFDYYLKILEGIKAVCPKLQIKAFTAVEIVDLAEKAGKSIEDTLGLLKAKGLGSLPGGGAEILSDDYFNRYCPDKPGPEIWLAVHTAAHKLGIPTNATMLFGFKESKEQRIEHLIRLRALQDESRKRGKGYFQCFVPLAYVNPKSEIRNSKQIQMFKIQNQEKTLEIEGNILDELKTIAISRLMLDNIEHIKAFWPMLGVNAAQIALSYGADDLDGTVQHYEIVDKGLNNADKTLTGEKIKALITEADRIPVQRDAYYQGLGVATVESEGGI